MKVYQRGYLRGKRIRKSNSGNSKISGKESNISYPYCSRCNCHGCKAAPLESPVVFCDKKSLKKQKSPS